MSIYNLVNGVNPAAFFILPMLGFHPDEYPRFRDCFVGELKNSDEKDQFGIPRKITNDEKVISVYTRVGGPNRSGYNDAIEDLRKMPNYIRDYDDDFDSTFATFIFSVPEQWKSDFDYFTKDEGTVSKEYVEEMKRVYPKLVNKFDELFKK